MHKLLGIVQNFWKDWISKTKNQETSATCGARKNYNVQSFVEAWALVVLSYEESIKGSDYFDCNKWVV